MCQLAPEPFRNSLLTFLFMRADLSLRVQILSFHPCACRLLTKCVLCLIPLLLLDLKAVACAFLCPLCRERWNVHIVASRLLCPLLVFTLHTSLPSTVGVRSRLVLFCVA